MEILTLSSESIQLHGIEPKIPLHIIITILIIGVLTVRGKIGLGFHMIITIFIGVLAVRGNISLVYQL